MKVYLIQSNTNGQITYKIGKTSRDANIRLAELSTGNAGEMAVVCEYESENSSLIEKALHSHYGHNRLSGEWFKDSIIPSDFLKICKLIDENIKKLKNSENPFI
jgi:hypothetical protein